MRLTAAGAGVGLVVCYTIACVAVYRWLGDGSWVARLTQPQIDHLFGVAVVGCDDCRPTCVANAFGNPTETGIDVLTSFDGFI